MKLCADVKDTQSSSAVLVLPFIQRASVASFYLASRTLAKATQKQKPPQAQSKKPPSISARQILHLLGEFFDLFRFLYHRQRKHVHRIGFLNFLLQVAC